MGIRSGTSGSGPVVARIWHRRRPGELGVGLNGRVGLDSVSGDNGELLMFDSRAVLDGRVACD